ncbi:MAG: hypothetical protein GX023_10080 [Tissierellia bacterium]|nr:hypothetical protein [Tissierellia bacterium]
MLKNPFIPLKKANTIIIDGRVSSEIMDNLKKLNLNIIPTIECKEVAKPIAYHPDIVMHPVDHKSLIIAPNVFEYYEEKLYGMGINLIKGDTRLGKAYPKDIAYNVGRMEGIAVHNFKYTDEKLKYYLKKQGLEFVHVNQGYTKCSMAIIDEKAVITADYVISKKLKDLAFDVLLIQPGYIELSGYNYGFIGGTCGNLSRDEIILTGTLDYHLDKKEILRFIKKYKKIPIWLSNKKIIDVGTMIGLYCQ